MAAAALPACAIIPEPRRASEGSPVTLSSVSLTEPRDAEPASLSIARQAVVSSLISKGLKVSAKSVLEMEVTLSSRPSTMALLAKSGDQKGNSSVTGAGRAARLDLCKDVIIRLSVSLVNLKTGKQLYRAHAEDQTCRALSEPLIKSLADEAMAGLRLSY